MDYKEMIEKAIKDGKSSEKAMWESVDTFNSMLSMMKREHPDMYWDLMREQHDVLYKGHYDESFAMYDVSVMWHKDKNGSKYEGQHWSVNDVEQATKGMIPSEKANKWDAYVALNSYYHDYIDLFREWFGTDTEAEKHIIEGAITFYFKDDDYDYSKGTKIWDYVCCMMS